MTPVPTQITLVVGNPKPHSRTRTVAVQATQLVRELLDRNGMPVGPTRLIDLAEMSVDLLGHGEHPGRLEEALEAVREPDGLLIVASPTFKAAYTGLLKLFIDLLPRGALSGVVAVPLMTAASGAHRYVVDSHLRALLVEAGACVPARGLCVLESEFDVLDLVLGEWCAAAVPVLAAVLGARAPLP